MIKKSIKFEKVKICDLCHSKSNFLFLKAKDRNYNTGEFTYVKCRNCGLIWQSPRPKTSSIRHFYPDSYSAHKVPTNTNKMQNILRFFIKNNNLIARILIKDYLFFKIPKGKILDVGAGNGSYLKILEEWGWHAYGIEINEKAVQMAKRLGIKKIKQTSLRNAKYPNNFFNVIRFSHVLEHVESPSKELKESMKKLKNKGQVLILIPNAGGVFSKVFKTYWYLLDPPRHLYQFTPKTLKKLLESLGFINIKIKYNQSPYSLIRSLLFLLGLKNVEKRIGLFVYPLGLILKIFNFLKISDSMEITARKP